MPFSSDIRASAQVSERAAYILPTASQHLSTHMVGLCLKAGKKHQ
jgi:hypothetical protein